MAHVSCGSKGREDEQVLDLGRQILQALTVRDHAIVRYSPRSIHVGFDHQVGTNRGCLLQVWRSLGRRNPTAYVDGSSSQKTHQGTKRGDHDEQDKVRPNAPQCFHRIHRLRTTVLGSHVSTSRSDELGVRGQFALWGYYVSCFWIGHGKIGRWRGAGSPLCAVVCHNSCHLTRR